MRAAVAREDARFPPRALLLCGAAAGPIYIVVGTVQILLRAEEGFDVRRHALSLLANGELGWVQVANFLVAGALVLAGALGLRQAIAGERGGLLGPLLFALFGFSLIGAGMFRADPAPDFPAGAALSAGGMSQNGLLHFAFGAIGFYALIAGCFVFAWHFAGRGRWIVAIYSVATGLAFLAAFSMIASGSPSPAVMLAFYAAVAWIWIWHAAVHSIALNDLNTARRA